MSTAKTNRIQNDRPHDIATSDYSQRMDHIQEAIEETVRENPLTATMIVFGVGFGVGAVIGSLLVNPAEQRRQHLARSLGHRILNSVSDLVPDGLQQRMPL